MKKTKQTKKKVVKIVERAIVYIKSSFNNTLISATDENGEVFAWATTGLAGFKGSKKSTPYASSQAAQIMVEKLKNSQVREMKIIVSGVSSGRDAAVRAFGSSGIKITSLKDKTPIPHNGCRPKKPRRV